MKGLYTILLLIVSNINSKLYVFRFSGFTS